MATVKQERIAPVYTITLSEDEAEKLVAILMVNVEWEKDDNGKFANDLYDELVNAGVPE
jgi:hypothetical protein